MPDTLHAHQPGTPLADLRLVVMGVSGCGKSTLAEHLATAWDLVMVEGDSLHSPESVRKMRSGIPLQDEDRWPWLERVGDALAAPAPGHHGRVVACSALKRAYRDVIRRTCPQVTFLFLEGSHAILQARMAQRQGHYMPPALLDSQLATLEVPGADESDVIHVRVDCPTQEQVAASRHALLARDRIQTARS